MAQSVKRPPMMHSALPSFHSCYLYIIFTVAFHVINFRLFSPVVSALSVLVFVVSLCSLFLSSQMAVPSLSLLLLHDSSSQARVGFLYFHQVLQLPDLWVLHNV